MTAPKNSHEVYLVVDPVQDYEESLKIYGAYGSLAAAKFALPRLRRKNVESWERRDTEVQLWRGDQHIATWRFSGDGAGRWTYRAEKAGA